MKDNDKGHKSAKGIKKNIKQGNYKVAYNESNQKPKSSAWKLSD